MTILENFINTEVFSLVIIPLLIFLARVCDVSIGTLRIIFLSKGYRFLAPFVGFFEVIIWLLAAREVFSSLNSWLPIIAYSLGFAAGTYVGIILEQRLSVGKVLLRVITTQDAKKIIEAFKEEDFPLISTHGVSSWGDIDMIFLVMNRKRLNPAINFIKEQDPKASYSVEDVRWATEAHPYTPWYKKRDWLSFGFLRKGK